MNHVVAINRPEAAHKLRERCEGHEPDPLPDTGQNSLRDYGGPHG